MKCFESSCCWLNDFGNAAMPPTIPTAIKHNEMMDQITPQHCDEPPYFFAKTLASELLTFLRIRSSQISQTLYSEDMTPMKS